MHTIEEQMREISRRKKRYVEAKKCRKYAITGAGLLASLVVVISIAPKVVYIIARNKISVLGSTILGAKTGSYVLVALIAFTLGVFVTMFCRQYMKNKADRTDKDKYDQG